MRELAEALEFQLLKHDRVAFAERLLPSLDDWQRELLESNPKRALLACARQVGKSTICAIVALHRALYFPGSLVLAVSPTLRQSAELTAKVNAFYRELGKPMPAETERKLSLELCNGSRIITLPGDADNVRGFSAPSLVLLDEAAFVPDEMYFALKPMMSVSSGALYLLSSPHGRAGAFYEEWENGGDAWERYRITAAECPRISEEYLASEKAALPWWIFQQEYMAEFTETQDSLFRYEDVMKSIRSDVTPLFPEDEQ
jgi:hypothetical protein